MDWIPLDFWPVDVTYHWISCNALDTALLTAWFNNVRYGHILDICFQILTQLVNKLVKTVVVLRGQHAYVVLIRPSMNISKELLLDIRVRLGLFYFYAKCGTDWFYDRNVRRETFAQIKIVQLQKQLFESLFCRLSSSCSIDAGSILIFTCYPDFGFSITIFDTCLESIWIVLLKILLRIQFRFKITIVKT